MSWARKRLEDVADFCLGKMLDQKKNKGDLLPYLANVNVRWGQFDFDDLREMRFEQHELDRFGLKDGDIVMCEGGEPGRCAIWKGQIPGMMIQKALHRIRPYECLSPEFLYYTFLHIGRAGRCAPLFTGATIRHLPREKLSLLGEKGDRSNLCEAPSGPFRQIGPVPFFASVAAVLDKPLKAHTLMRAIARANRVNEGKNSGLIVDYCGILKHLRKALATFAGTQPGGEGGETDPAKPDEELLAELAEAIHLVRGFLDERHASLDDVIQNAGFVRNAAIVACKEAANENDETRKRFEVMCREVFNKFTACINADGVNAHRADRDAINIVYMSLPKDREQADIIRQLHQVVDEAIETKPDHVGEASVPYDISKIDFERLRQEFQRSRAKQTATQNLRQAIERRVQRLLLQNPLRTDFQRHYEDIVAEYNREKDRVTIEKTFEALLKLAQALGQEEQRAIREGLDEESLAVFDLLKKPDLSPAEIKRIKAVAVDLLETLKAEKVRVDHWQDREATRDAVRLAIKDFLWSDDTGLPVDNYDETAVQNRAEEVYRHVYRVYPTLPSPYYETSAAA